MVACFYVQQQTRVHCYLLCGMYTDYRRLVMVLLNIKCAVVTATITMHDHMTLYQTLI